MRFRDTFRQMRKDFSDMFDDFDKIAEHADSFSATATMRTKDMGPLPDGVSEETVTEVETKPDGTRITRTITRRRTVEKK